MSAERPVVYILGTFPQASQTFVAREIRGLRQAGVPLQLFALRLKTADALEPQDRAWYDDVLGVPAALAPGVLLAHGHYLLREPRRYVSALGALLSLRHQPAYLALRALVLFLRAAWIAKRVEASGGCRHIHAHFALAQTEVAMVVSTLLDCPFSFTAHAYDIYASPSALEQKMRAASAVVTCTAYNVGHLRQLCPELPATRIQLVHHGVETVDGAVTRATGSQLPPVLIAAGRLVGKKGFDTLVEACAILRSQRVDFQCRIHGDGPERDTLTRLIVQHQLTPRVSLEGWTPAPQLLRAMEGATVFAMPSRVADGGDRDGIPNVVLEAMAVGLPVVATRLSGIPEAVLDGRTGLLVEPGNPAELADALRRLIDDEALRDRLGAEARRHVAEEFSLPRASARLRAVFSHDLR